MDRERFERLVEEALSGLPRKFKKHLHNIAVIVEDKPVPGTRGRSGTPSSNLLLGLYHGVPLKHRGPYYGNIAPDVIVIYQQPIEQICRSDDEIKERVREVVLHEVGHYFGLSERELRDIED
jgi:predicted Zn-dependent protease with MMP-like domain